MLNVDLLRCLWCNLMLVFCCYNKKCLTKSNVRNNCEAMQDVQKTANLSASLVDQLLPESEGFQMLQSISIETKTKNTYSMPHQTFNWTVRQLSTINYYLNIFIIVNKEMMCFFSFRLNCSLKRLVTNYTPMCTQVPQYFGWLRCAGRKIYRLTYLHFLSCSLKSIFKNVT